MQTPCQSPTSAPLGLLNGPLSAQALPFTALDLAFARYLQSARPSADPCHAWLAALVSHQFGRGHACLDLELLRHNGVQALAWEARFRDVLPTDLAQAADSLPWTRGDASPLVLDGPRLYLRRNWQAEQAIRSAILTRLSQPCVVPDTLEQALDSLFDRSPVTTDPSDAAAVAAVTPDWQKVACALAARGRITLITGGPGTGKTTTVVRLLALLQSQSARPLRIALAAPTGKAAARLGESIAQALRKLPAAMQAHIPTQAQTLHKLLQVRAAVQATPTPELALDLVVVDEASMIDLELMARLMAAVPLSANLILLGDKDQLASVEAGAVMGQLCEGAQAGGYSADTVQWLRHGTGQDVSAWQGAGLGLAQQTVMLRHSHRFAAGSVIGQWARAVNAGERDTVAELWDATPPWRADQGTSVTRLQPVSATQASVAALVRAGWQGAWNPLQTLRTDGAVCSDTQALALLQALSRFQVLCALREGPWGLLALNRSIALALDFPTDGWYVGRPIMVTRNDYNLNLMNGDVGLCLPTARGLRVAFAATGPDGGTSVRWVLPSRLDALETVFAMTVHKSQGSEFEHVALVLPDRAAPVLTRELLYTGITRAKTHLTLVVPQAGVLRQAVATRILRSGGLTFSTGTR
jgi:exodeoxyribonuclease V alpha subunit